MTVKVGQQRPARMRRIGERHVVVLPAQQAVVLSLDAIEAQLAQARTQRQHLQAQLARLDAFIADIEQQHAAIIALPIERDDDDPVVPQPPATVPPPREPPAFEDPEQRFRTDNGDFAAELKGRARPVHLPIVKA